MKNWWLEVYTKPQILRVLIAALIAMAIALTGMWIKPQYFVWYFSLYLVPVFLFLSAGVDGLYNNLEFHKMSLSHKKLQKIFWSDLALQIISFLMIMFVSILIPMKIFFPAADIRMHPILMLLTGSASYTLLSSVLFMLFVLNSRTLKLKKDTDSLLSFGVIVLCGVLFYSGQVFISLALLLMGLATRFFYAHECSFHKKPSPAVLYLIPAVALIYAMGCGFLVKAEMNTKYVKLGYKYKTMFVFKEFVPKLSPESVRLLMTSSHAADIVFRKAPKGIYKMPVEIFIRSNDLKAISAYLKYGKPTDDNLFYLSKIIETKPYSADWKNTQDYKAVRAMLVKAWAPAEKLPQELMSDNHREVASEF